MIVRPIAALLLGAATVLCSGCGGGPSEVTGSVTIDGNPLEEGQIIFESMDGKSTPAGAPIKDGKYTASVLPGEKKVKVTASRPTKKIDPVMGAAAKESAVAAEFNERTTLKAEIKPGPNSGVDFAVKSRP